ncbi:MAG: sugar phosphate isomerase/epimerase [Eubacteriales bacterium]|nr:sugar phosphate isomerase/epimerase [Eubacteriales bacterium]MDD4475838.1 sugar phosphate isomerase/epimerase [Eubacteriales bacterium]
MKKPVAIQLYSVRTDAEKNLYSTLKALKKTGYDGIEFAGFYGHTPEEIKDMLSDIGLVPISAHVSYADFIADAEKIASDYAEVGVKYIGIPYLNPENRPGAEKYDETVANMKRFSKILREKGIGLLYHNHEFEFEKINGVYKLDILFSAFNHDELQTEIDLCWTAVSGQDPAEYLVKYSGRSPVVHFKDFYKEGHTGAKLYDLIGIKDETPSEKAVFEYRPIGTGMQNIPSLLDAVEKAGCEWIIIEQDEPTESKNLSRMECAEISITNLKKLMG